MNYQLDKQGLLDRLSVWNGFLKRKVRLIACGGTALTLLGVKASTKDIDLLVPDSTEYEYLIKVIEQLGYKRASGSGWARGDGFIFDLFKGKLIHTTELLDSPLDKNRHFPLKEYSHIYIGVLNFYDLMISKLFRGNSIDIEDCKMLVKAKSSEMDINAFIRRFRETASYDVSEEKVNKNLDHFLKVLRKEGLYDEK